MKLYKHQKETVKFLKNHPRALVTSTCGTGKTISVLETWHRYHKGKMLVIAPKSTLGPVWGNDCNNYYTDTKIGIFNRKDTRQDGYVYNLLMDNDIVVINIEAANLILEQSPVLSEYYTTLVIDEFTAIKNRTAKRSKNVAKLALYFEYRYLLSGTPTPNGILDIWHPALIADNGVRLGNNFFHFRNTVCQPVARGYHQQFTEWVEIPGAADVVASTLKDITIRHVLEDVVDMPERIYRTLEVEMPAKLHKSYRQLKQTAILEFNSGDVVTAANKAVLGNKLLQAASGSLYDTDGNSKILDTSKYELIVELIKEREHSLVFYQWNHQCEELEWQLKKEKIKYAVISGLIKQADRTQIIADYQKGKYQTLLLQPASAAHGITLTLSEASIWCSPTWNLEHFIQANYRDYRIGQRKRTEVIMIQYANTIEKEVYKRLTEKRKALDNLLTILKS